MPWNRFSAAVLLSLPLLVGPLIPSVSSAEPLGLASQIGQATQFIKPEALIAQLGPHLGVSADMKFQFVEDFDLRTKNGEPVISGRLQTSSQLPTIRVSLRFPQNFDSNKKYPTVLLLGGTRSALETIARLPSVGENILVTFQYPSINQLEPLKSLDRDLKTMPAQITSLLMWLNQQEWVDSFRLSAVGVSFGGLVLPVSLTMAQSLGVHVNSVVFAYTGGELAHLIAQNSGAGQRERNLIENGLLLPSLLVDPVIFLPHLQGRFLLIMSEEDEIFGPLSTQAFIRATPEPKEVILIDGEHISAHNQELIEQLMGFSFEWLTRVGAVNSPY